MSTIQEVPDEILVKIFSLISIKDLCKVSQVSHRMRKISQDNCLWREIRIWAQVVPKKFMQKMIKFEVQYLSLECCFIKPLPVELLKENNMNLKYLNISKCLGDDEFLANLVASSKSLECINFGETRGSLVYKCIQNIPLQNSITTINFTGMAKLVVENGPGWNKLTFASIKILIDNCQELINVSFSNTILSNESISYICKKLTNKALKINFSGVKVRDEDIDALAKNCTKLEYLNLTDTWVTLEAVPEICRTWSKTLVDLSLPEEIGIVLGLHEKETIDHDLKIFASKIQSMPNLQYLHIGDLRGNLNPMMKYKECITEETSHREKLQRLFPNLGINMDPLFDPNYPGDLQWKFYLVDSNLKPAGLKFPRTQTNFWFFGVL